MSTESPMSSQWAHEFRSYKLKRGTPSDAIAIRETQQKAGAVAVDAGPPQQQSDSKI